MNKKLKTNNDVQREKLNAAIQDFISRGGRIKKVNAGSYNKQDSHTFGSDDDIADILCYSVNESFSVVPFRRSSKITDSE